MTTNNPSDFSFLSQRRAPGKRQVRVRHSVDDVDEDSMQELYGIKIDLHRNGFASNDADSDDYRPDKKKRKQDSDDEDDDEERSEDSASGSDNNDSNSSDDSSGDEDSGDESDSDDSSSESQTNDQPCTSTSLHNGVAVNGNDGRMCCLCLNLRPLPREIEKDVAQCDKCGICVHETCYGAMEDPLEASSPIPKKPSIETRSPDGTVTESWFCDVCCAGLDARRVYCELCPNTGGVLKMTDAGRWVHLMCALYTQGVSFGNVLALSNVSLYEMDYRRYGSKACAYCDDKLLARTGVTTQCDAGMCRVHFHITCAERLGLLVDKSIDKEETDPYFGNCKKHSNKDVAKAKARKYAYMIKQQTALSSHVVMDEKTKIALVAAQKAFAQDRPKPIVQLKGDERWPRYLHSSAEYVQLMMDKCIQDMNITRSQWSDALLIPAGLNFVPPAFSEVFIRYYQEREEQTLPDTLKRLEAVEKETEALRKEMAELEEKVKNKHSPKTKSKQHMSVEEAKAIIEKLKDLHEQCTKYGNKCELPQFVKDAQVLFARKESEESTLPTSRALKIDTSDKKPSRALLSPGKVIEVYKCAECKKTHSQHLLALCDTCHNHYHLACLMPPLTKMPIKTATSGWECSKCAYPTSSADEAESTVTDSSRTRTRTTKPTRKLFTPQHEPQRKRKPRNSVANVTPVINDMPKLTPYVVEDSDTSSTV